MDQSYGATHCKGSHLYHRRTQIPIRFVLIELLDVG
jgi:hypothetical protein